MKMFSVLAAAMICFACGDADGDLGEGNEESAVAASGESGEGEAQNADATPDCADGRVCDSKRATFARGPKGKGTVYK